MKAWILGRYPALGARAYRHYWLASLASVGATQMMSLTQGWLIFELSGSAMDLGVLGAAASIPAIVMTLAGGVLADRYEKRSLLLITSTITAALFLIQALLDATGIVEVWHVWVIAALTATVVGVDWPTRQAYFTHLIPREAMLSAVALNSVLWQVTRMVIPAGSGFLMAWLGTSSVFFLCVAGFVVMAVVIAMLDVRVIGLRNQSPWAQVLEGLNFAWSQPVFKHLITLSFCGMFFATSYMQLMPAFAAALGTDEIGYGILLSATGLGSVVGTLVIGGIAMRHMLGAALLLGAGLSAVAVNGFALAAIAGWFAVALLLAAVASAFNSVLMILLTTVLQREVPDALRGRVMGIHSITYSLMPLGGLMLGALATYVGVPVAVMLSATLFLLIVLAISWRSTDVRSLAETSASDSPANETES